MGGLSPPAPPRLRRRSAERMGEMRVGPELEGDVHLLQARRRSRVRAACSERVHAGVWTAELARGEYGVRRDVRRSRGGVRRDVRWGAYGVRREIGKRIRGWGKRW